MGKDMVTTQNKNSDITERIENSHPGHRNAPYKIFETLNEMSTLIKLNSPRIPLFLSPC